MNQWFKWLWVDTMAKVTEFLPHTLLICTSLFSQFVLCLYMLVSCHVVVSWSLPCLLMLPLLSRSNKPICCALQDAQELTVFCEECSIHVVVFFYTYWQGFVILHGPEHVRWVTTLRCACFITAQVYLLWPVLYEKSSKCFVFQHGKMLMLSTMLCAWT